MDDQIASQIVFAIQNIAAQLAEINKHLQNIDNTLMTQTQKH
jgi:hypothetical protein